MTERAILSHDSRCRCERTLLICPGGIVVLDAELKRLPIAMQIA
jgi:hypothetical protein